jgi:hypothetical protein
MRVAFVLLVVLAFILPRTQVSGLASDTSPVRPVHTFSIVARDPVTMERLRS